MPCPSGLSGSYIRTGLDDQQEFCDTVGRYRSLSSSSVLTVGISVGQIRSVGRSCVLTLGYMVIPPSIQNILGLVISLT